MGSAIIPSIKGIWEVAPYEARINRSGIPVSAGSGIHRKLGAEFHRGDDRIEEYDQVEGKVFSHCVPQGMPKLVERYRGSLIPSRAFADGGIHEAIAYYEDAVFFDILAESWHAAISAIRIPACITS